MSNSVSMSEHFQRLGAPLRAVRQSWGAISPTGEVLLRVFQNEIVGLSVQVWGDDWSTGFGGTERHQHLLQMEANGRGYAIVCQSADGSACSKIKAYDEKRVAVLSAPVRVGTKVFCRIEGMLPVAAAKQAITEEQPK